MLLALVVLGGTAYLLARDYLPGGQAAPPGPAAARLPDGLVGTWNGTQNEPASGRDFGVRVDLTSGAVGERVGEMSFSVFDCRFDLVLTSVQGTTDMAARPIAGRCSEGVVRATEAGPDRFTYETLAGDQVVATRGSHAGLNVSRGAQTSGGSSGTPSSRSAHSSSGRRSNTASSMPACRSPTSA